MEPVTSELAISVFVASSAAVFLVVAVSFVVGVVVGGRVAMRVAFSDLVEHNEGLGLDRPTATAAARAALRRRVK